MKSQTDYSTLYMHQTVTYTRLYTVSSVSTDNAGVIDNKQEIFQCNEIPLNPT